MKKAVLGSIDPAQLTGKTVTVTGVFKLINPKNWLVTPVKVEVK
jgi:predicted lipoprotein